MKNITKLACWKELEKIGFVPIKYKSFGKLFSIGASLQAHGIDVYGKPFTHDIIIIEPHDFNYSNKCYHVTGKISIPYCVKLKDGQTGKDIFRIKERENEFYPANKILIVINSML